uniref:Uncharacterized protein n=1 Tax=Glossina brevipalpis TaxID=37001 RepID=A0A1A9X3R6_9MUSC
MLSLLTPPPPPQPPPPPPPPPSPSANNNINVIIVGCISHHLTILPLNIRTIEWRQYSKIRLKSKVATRHTTLLQDCNVVKGSIQTPRGSFLNTIIDVADDVIIVTIGEHADCIISTRENRTTFEESIMIRISVPRDYKEKQI